MIVRAAIQHSPPVFISGERENPRALARGMKASQRTKSFGDVDCSLKQEVQFVRMDKSISLEFEAHRL